MVVEDYIMRLIKEMVRTILKLLFNIDLEKATYQIKNEEETNNFFEYLLKQIENGNINEAENEVYEKIDTGNSEAIKIALLFYSYLNEKDDDFLLENNFSREEIRDGLKYLAKRQGMSGLSEVFLKEF